LIREYRLSPPGSGCGVSCDENGAFVGNIPLLKRSNFHGKDRWEPRDCNELSRQVGRQFGLPVDMSPKIGGIEAISNALNEGNVARAQIATLLLGIPEPPTRSQDSGFRGAMVKFILHLHWSGLLGLEGDRSAIAKLSAEPSVVEKDRLAKAGYNPDEPRDQRGRWTNGGDAEGRLIPAQATIVEPLIGPLFDEMVRPFPGTIDVVPPMALPRAQNPYLDRPECVEEWIAAEQFCRDLMRRAKFGKDGYRGFGKNYQKCLLGQLSEDCGANPVA
jgi:hypothetical protein